MKTILKISLVLNLGLLASLAFIWTNRSENLVAMAMPVTSKIKPSARNIEVSATLTAQQIKPQPFHWSQLESPDYSTYVKNLRRICCPEPTLRAIVTADVDAWHQARSLELEHKLSEFDNLSWSEKLNLNNSRQAWLAELQKLPGQKKSEIATLLGGQRGPTSEAAADAALSSSSDAALSPQMVAALSLQENVNSLSQTATVSSPEVSRSHHTRQNAIVYPLVFREVDPAVANLNAQQMQAIKDLRQTFVDEIGGPGQDPSDPDYLQRWLKAQTDVDKLLQGMLGNMAWETYQVATWTPPPGG